ncbi:hypothetical protein PILCRDRAFT_3324 [Piloderma croceum F 1598]|uniref:Uncharacterized protein n=1 Tax=Piloderma croceum (strain F 1598) TaxID=765440 RepID=A0A0C3BP90_PILCF|nr:hypothetical protein PILCRDRAFT_3324 [Piloderma croceum F 1598]
MASCNVCGVPLDTTLKAQTEAYHTPQVPVTFHSYLGHTITLFRDASGLFQCPACLVCKPTYMGIYSHCKNTNNPAHNGKVDAFFDNWEAGGIGSLTTLTEGPQNESDAINLMFQGSQKDAGINNENDMEFEMDSFYEPYIPTPVGSPQGTDRDGDIPMDGVSQSPDLPQYMTKQKGKRKASISHMCLSLSTSQLPLPKPLNDSETVPTSRDLDFLTIPIPYGNPTIITSVMLNAINCVIADQALVLQVNIDILVRNLGIHEGDMIDGISNPLVVPGIPFQSGLYCAFPNCNHARISHPKMAEHIRLDHLSTIKQWEPQVYAVQAIYKSNSKYYPMHLPTEAQVSDAPPDLNQVLAFKYAEIVSQVDSKMNLLILSNSAHLPPFLAKYKWHDIIVDLEPSQISCRKSPPMPDEPSLTGLAVTVTGYYDIITKDMELGKAWMMVLHYINTSKLPLNNQPF